MIQALQQVHMSGLAALVGLPIRRMYYMAFLPGREPPEPEAVIYSYADYVAALQKSKPKPENPPKQTNI